MGRCELTGKGPVVKNLVSHSNIKTKTIAQPNVQKKRLFSRILNELVTLRIATSAIRSMEHMGGFDKFILNQKDGTLSKRALAVRKRIHLKMKGVTATAATTEAAPAKKAAAPKAAATKAKKPAAKKTAAKKA